MALRDQLRLAIRQGIKDRFDEARSGTTTDTFRAAPRNTGRMARSIRNTGSRYVGDRLETAITVDDVARYTDEGTGVYGPNRQRIRPKRAGGVLVFFWVRGPRGPDTYYYRSVRGTPAQHWFREPMAERWRTNLAAAFRRR